LNAAPLLHLYNLHLRSRGRGGRCYRIYRGCFGGVAKRKRTVSF